MVKRISVMVMVMSFLCAGCLFAGDGTIGHLFKGKPEVKVYIKEVVNDSGSQYVSAGAFKTVLEEAFVNRKAMIFRLVSEPSDSDIQVSAIIKKFQYLKRGPFKPSIGIETTLLDVAATMTENYAEMAVDFTVVATNGATVLWKDSVEDYEKKLMKPERGFTLISDKVSREFLWYCFGKPNRARRNFLR